MKPRGWDGLETSQTSCAMSFPTPSQSDPSSGFSSQHLAPRFGIAKRQISSKRHFYPQSVAIWALIYVIFPGGDTEHPPHCKMGT